MMALESVEGGMAMVWKPNVKSEWSSEGDRPRSVVSGRMAGSTRLAQYLGTQRTQVRGDTHTYTQTHTHTHTPHIHTRTHIHTTHTTHTLHTRYTHTTHTHIHTHTYTHTHTHTHTHTLTPRAPDHTSRTPLPKTFSTNPGR